MNKMKFIYFLILFLPLNALVYSQENIQNDSVLNAALDELLFEGEEDLYELFDTKTNFHFLYFSTSYSNKTYYAGREFQLLDESLDTISIANAAFQFYYFISNGFFFGTSVAWYNKMEPALRTSVFTLGYANGLKNHDFLRYRASYNRYIYLSMGTDYVPNFSNKMALGFTLKKKKVGLRFDYSLMTGTDSIDHQLSLDVYGKLKLFSLGAYDKVQFKPEISTFIGNELIEEDIAEGNPNSPFYEPNYIYYNKFGLLNTQIILPLSISYKNFDFELSYTYNLPRTYDPVYFYPNSGFLQFSLGYILRIK